MLLLTVDMVGLLPYLTLVDGLAVSKAVRYCSFPSILCSIIRLIILEEYGIIRIIIIIIKRRSGINPIPPTVIDRD